MPPLPLPAPIRLSQEELARLEREVNPPVATKPKPAARPPQKTTLSPKSAKSTGGLALPSIAFRPEFTTLRPDGKAPLVTVAETLRTHPSLRVAVVGSTERGERAGIVLARLRAVNIRNALVNRGVRRNRMVIATQVGQGRTVTVTPLR